MSQAFRLFYNFTRAVRAQLFLVDEAVVDPFNNFKLLPGQNHLSFSALTASSKISTNRPQESTNSR